MWDILWWVLCLVYVPSCVLLIVIVLLQKGKGVGFAGAFGIGPGSDTIFGPRASKSLPQKLTYAAAAIFMTLAFVMSMISGRLGKGVAPETVSETAAKQIDLSGLDNIGSQLEEEEGTAEGVAAPAEGTEPAPNESASPESPGSEEVAPVEATPETVPEASPTAPAPDASVVTPNPVPAPEPEPAAAAPETQPESVAPVPEAGVGETTAEKPGTN